MSLYQLCLVQSKKAVILQDLYIKGATFIDAKDALIIDVAYKV